MRKILFSIIAISTLIVSPTQSHAADCDRSVDKDDVMSCSNSGNTLTITLKDHTIATFATGCGDTGVLVSCTKDGNPYPTKPADLGDLCENTDGKDGGIPAENDIKIGKCVSAKCGDYYYTNYAEEARPQTCDKEPIADTRDDYPKPHLSGYITKDKNNGNISTDKCVCTYTKSGAEGEQITCPNNGTKNWDSGCYISACGGGYCVKENSEKCEAVTSGFYSGAGVKECKQCPAPLTQSTQGATAADQCYTNADALELSDNTTTTTFQLPTTNKLKAFSTR